MNQFTPRLSPRPSPGRGAHAAAILALILALGGCKPTKPPEPAEETPPTPGAGAAPSSPAPPAPAPARAEAEDPPHAVSREIFRVVFERGVDGTPGAARLEKTTLTASVPPAFAAFQRWQSEYLAAPPGRRPALLERGLALAKNRAEALSGLIASEPRSALALALTPADRQNLPPEILQASEDLLMGTGLYAVAAICNHAPDAPHDSSCRIEREIFIAGNPYKASIYGSRKDRLTEEEASLYAVAIGNQAAVHEDDVVVLPASKIRPEADGLAAVFHGKIFEFPNENALREWLATLHPASPPNSP